MSSSLPKLSYVLLSHNREKYIRAAIESAFAQDYEGELEYIFSDDCSTDRTFEIIQECVAAYKGNRRIVVTQTPKNLHLAGNTNHAVQFVESDWIVRADDDDVSTYNRCTLVGKAIAENPGCSYVYTKLETFTDDCYEHIYPKLATNETYPGYSRIDVLLGEHHFWQSFNETGVLHQVWSAEHFKKFGPLPIDGYWIDDVIANIRCCLLGFGVKIDAVTAYIRTGSMNMSRGGDNGSTSFSSIIRLEKFNDRYYNTTQIPLTKTIKQASEYINAHISAAPDSFIKTLEEDLKHRSLLCTFWRKGIWNRIKISRALGYSGLFSMLRCLPMPIFAALLHIYRALLNKL